ncbi:hypothetical protein [Psychrobacter pygoscelis]|uniref:hypothetical protein n=1 Tax=Psychrobacter pygoscelis TaxID=2488563 RepID=UPI00103B51CB|nr:hypothetical protein [Psychrobacter pygoscelis]
MKSFIRENTYRTTPLGWGNGYVVIPKSSSWHGVEYTSIPVDVHGGLTWSSLGSEFVNDPDCVDGDAWIIGFDICHHGDDINNCSKKYVEAETASLLQQMQELDKFGFAKSQRAVICPHCGEAHSLEPIDSIFVEVEKRTCLKCHKEFYCEVNEQE